MYNGIGNALKRSHPLSANNTFPRVGLAIVDSFLTRTFGTGVVAYKALQKGIEDTVVFAIGNRC